MLRFMRAGRPSTRWASRPHLITLSILGYALTRFAAYSSLIGTPHKSAGPMVISDDGTYTWVWTAGWALVGLLAVFDWVTRRTYAIPFLFGMMMVWGFSYLVAWALSGFTSMDWLTIFTYWAPALIIITIYRGEPPRIIYKAGD